MAGGESATIMPAAAKPVHGGFPEFRGSLPVGGRDQTAAGALASAASLDQVQLIGVHTAEGWRGVMTIGVSSSAALAVRDMRGLAAELTLMADAFDGKPFG